MEIACGYTDLRRGIDGLAGIVRAQFQMDPFQTALFLFCGRRRDRIKALYWEGDGFLLLYKRLESGSFQWPRTKDEVRTLTPPTVPLAHGRLENRTAKSKQNGIWIKRDIVP